MKKLFTLLVTVAVAMILVTACNKEKNVVPGSKNHRMDEPAIDVIVEEMEVGSFSGVRNNTNFDVIIVPSTEYGVVVEAQEVSAVETVTAEVNTSGTLTVTAPANVTEATVYVEAPVVETVEIVKNGNIRIEGNYTQLDVKLGGNGKAILVGSANTLRMSGNGNGQVDALGMPAIDVVVNMKGNSNTRVAAQNTLNVDLTGNSKVYYSGNPVITKKLKGNAQLIKL